MKLPKKSQSWIVVCDWGIDKTFDFFNKASKALDAGHDAENQGADVIVAEVWRLRMNKKGLSK